MDRLGLVSWQPGGTGVQLRTASFYKYQTYIQQNNRRTMAESVPNSNNGGDQRETPQIIKEQREAAQKGASLSPSPSPSPSLSPSPLSSRARGKTISTATAGRNGHSASDDKKQMVVEQARQRAGPIAEALVLPKLEVRQVKSICGVLDEPENAGMNGAAVAEDYVGWQETLPPSKRNSDRIAGWRNQMKMRRGNPTYLLTTASAAAKDSLQSQLEDAQRRSAATWGTPLPNGAHHA
jgi:hypothetical protein